MVWTEFLGVGIGFAIAGMLHLAYAQRTLDVLNDPQYDRAARASAIVFSIGLIAIMIGGIGPAFEFFVLRGGV